MPEPAASSVMIGTAVPKLVCPFSASSKDYHSQAW